MLRNLIALTLAGATAFAAPAAQRQPAPDRASLDEVRAAKALAGLVPGTPQTCITPSFSQSGSHFGNVVLVRDRSGKLYRSNFQAGCTANENDALITQRHSTRLCRGDIVEVRDLTADIFRGACVYSDFVPYTRPK